MEFEMNFGLLGWDLEGIGSWGEIFRGEGSRIRVDSVNILIIISFVG